MIISIANQKGGVGKTTTALNLGAGLNREGHKVLLIDLDLQTDLTIGLGLPEAGYNINNVMNGRDIKKAILKMKNGLNVIPASVELKSTQLDLRKTDVLLKALANIKKEYDVIIIDTNPGMTILNINSIRASDMILIPILPEYLSLRGLKDFTETIEQLNTRFDIKPAKVKILVTNYDIRKAIHTEAVDMVRRYFKKKVLDSIIRTNVALSESVSHGQSIFDYQINSHGSQDYNSLTNEIIREVKK